MQINEGTHEDIYKVAVDMRQSDFLEFIAVSNTEAKIELAAELARRYGSAPVSLVGRSDDGDPICVGITYLARPNVVSLGFFATPRFPEIGRGITKFIKTNLFPKLRDNGVHRIEAVSMATHTEAHRWLKTLGLKQEGGVLRKFGKNGEDFVQFAWVADGS